ncbi:hypothetical protein CVT26_001098 [Gymnopilus dilepis]|uniref:Uncharacterized protein n=1 Tax=Gymnopilus dilepis TaxID=231916 RepID=A0A409WYP2_9AGAR|nr:hypothetical protein CVT26_001098 [Gymnopilus dilepis]
MPWNMERIFLGRSEVDGNLTVFAELPPVRDSRESARSVACAADSTLAITGPPPGSGAEPLLLASWSGTSSIEVLHEGTRKEELESSGIEGLSLDFEGRGFLIFEESCALARLEEESRFMTKGEGQKDKNRKSRVHER